VAPHDNPLERRLRAGLAHLDPPLDADAVVALARRSRAASRVPPDGVEDPAALRRVAAIVRGSYATNAAPKDGAADTTANVDDQDHDDAPAA
jgi:hypothetical protein